DIFQPQQAAAFEKTLADISTTLGISLDELVNSLGDEGFVSIQFSKTATIDVPTQNGSMTIPAPSLLIGLAVKDDKLHKVMEARLSAIGLPLMKLPAGDTTLQSLTLPLPIPMPLQISFAMSDGFILLGTSAQVVTDAIDAHKTKRGLITTSDFKTAFAGLPMSNNGSAYISARFVETMLSVQKAMVESAAKTQNQNLQMRNVISNLLQNKETPRASASITLNMKNGVLFRSIGPSGGREMMTAAFVAPIGMIAATAAPGFARGRQVSSRNACINNLRQIDAAKEQWALAEGKHDGDMPDIAGVCEYIKGGKIPICPSGGVYSFNPIGVAPSCSIKGHNLSGF
ncbi:MAG: hypothetical protein JXN60_05735, partial [Lentisphaerae bacterium]|nr:hypothetical protein [Lentisphaerota bacterium]